MAVYQNNEFLDTDVILNNNEYRNCRLIRCKLIYDASGPMTLTGCHIEDCNWFFEGAASDTIAFLSTLYNMDGDLNKKMIDRMFLDIKAGSIKPK